MSCSDAVALEGALHRELAEQRVNRVNLHRTLFRTQPAHVRDLLTRIAGSHLPETDEAIEWRASGTHTTLAPLPAEQVLPDLGSEDANDQEPPVELALEAPALTAGNVMALAATPRLTLEVSGGGEEIDSVALLLTDKGVVRGDGDLVSFGQPDHDSAALVLAADEEGALQALHVDTTKTPAGVCEVLVTVQVTGIGEQPAGACAVDVSDLASGAPLGRAALPALRAGGMVQVGALQRQGAGWVLAVHPVAMEKYLGALMTEAGVNVD